MVGGYTAKILEVDLGERHVSQRPIDAEVAHHLIGGGGLGTKFLWVRTSPGMNLLEPGSPLMLLTGPLPPNTITFFITCSRLWILSILLTIW